jgi:hypothetical protein
MSDQPNRDHPSNEELEAGLDNVRRAPANGGELQMIVRRPKTEEREVIDEAELCTDLGLVGDNWKARGYRKTADGSAHPDMQLNIMGARAATLVAHSRDGWHLAGDQLFVDMDLSDANLPPGTRLRLGEALIEVTAQPHLGCKKFVARFGMDSMKFVNSEVGKSLHLRGINAKVIESGKIRVGDSATKV